MSQVTGQLLQLKCPLFQPASHVQCLQGSNVLWQCLEPMYLGQPSIGITMTPSSPWYSTSLHPCSHGDLFPSFRNVLSLTPLWISKAHSLISIHQEHLEIPLSRASCFIEGRKSYSLPVVSASSLIKHRGEQMTEGYHMFTNQYFNELSWHTYVHKRGS